MTHHSEAFEAVLALARRDPNVYIEFVSGYQQGRIHEEMQADFFKRSTYHEWPRGHGKTDQSIYRDAWEIGNNPDLLIKVCKANKDEARDYVSGVKAVMESDEHKLVFPDMVPDPNQWGTMALRVRRKSLSKDPSIKAVGIFGNPGGRADIMRFDDICTLKNSVQNPVQREQVKEFYASTWLPMVKKGGRIHRICTPWHIDDITRNWRESRKILTRRYPCIGTLKSPWPEYWTPEMLEERREEFGEIAYSRAYLLVPVTGDELVFRRDELESAFYPLSDRRHLSGRLKGRIVCAIDLAFTEKEQPHKSKKADPDYSVILIGFLADDGTTYILDGFRGQVRFSEFKKIVRQKTQKWNIEYGVIEEVGYQKELNDQLQADTGLRLRRLPRTQDKHARATTQQPTVQAGLLRFPAQNSEVLPIFAPFIDELCDFPLGNHDDAVDATVDLMGEARKLETRTKRTFSVYRHQDIMDMHERWEAKIHGDDESPFADDADEDDWMFFPSEREK